MSGIERIACIRCDLPGYRVRKPNAFGCRADGRYFYAKTGAEGVGQNSVWLGNECIYYGIAARSGLRMPAAAILTLEEALFWGSEYVEGRDSLFELVGGGNHMRESGELLKQLCTKSDAVVADMAKALLLDVALLNNDRQPWNVLSWRDVAHSDVFFFDHEKTLVGDGIEASGLMRVSEAALSDLKIGDYLQCIDANRVVLARVDEAALRRVFYSLVLTDEALTDALNDCPDVWVNSQAKQALKNFLPRWWAYLRGSVDRHGAKWLLSHGRINH